MNTLPYRHEVKHEINWSDLIAIRQRLRVIAEPDRHAADGKYLIRSLYFDNLYDKALREKIDGVNMREKFRIRYYNGDPSVIHLEKKSKANGLGTKASCSLSAKEAQCIVDGDIGWIMEAAAQAAHQADARGAEALSETEAQKDGIGLDTKAEAVIRRPLLEELYCKMRYQGLHPKTIVDYTREPYTYAPGNVRVTFDYNIRTGLFCTDFLNPDCPTIPAVPRGDPETTAGASGIILEVKWDAYLPDIIRDAVQIRGRRETAFSKYAACRMYD